MVTGMLAVRNLLHGERNDLWSVNTDQEYHEQVYAPADGVDDVLERVFAKLDRWAFACAVGAAVGVSLMLATITLVLRGGEQVGPHLALLANYFPGYRVTALGSLIGAVYGFATGFGLGWAFALLRNTMAFLYETLARRRLESGLFGRFLDSI
jgi:hypothetical protein